MQYQQLRNSLGLDRKIERHNFLIKNILRKQAAEFDYKGRVVDLGCGDSPYRDIILQVADEYYGVDHPRSAYKNTFVCVAADLTEPLPFKAGAFDTVVSFQVLDDLPEPAKYLSECFRIMKPGGFIFLTVPFMWKIHEEPHDYYRFTKYGLQYLLKKGGYENIAVEEIYAGFWGMWLLKFNYYTARFLRKWNKYAWYVLWWATQTIAMLLDKFTCSEAKAEATHYAVRAQKA
jgi:SAM-dependent methyltransferase